MTGSEQRGEVEVVVCGACLDEFEVFEGVHPGLRLSCPHCGEPVTLVDIEQAQVEGYELRDFHRGEEAGQVGG